MRVTTEVNFCVSTFIQAHLHTLTHTYMGVAKPRDTNSSLKQEPLTFSRKFYFYRMWQNNPVNLCISVWKGSILE